MSTFLQMDGENHRRYQIALTDSTINGTCDTSSPVMVSKMSAEPNDSEIITLIKTGKVLMVNSRRRNGLILYKPFHAEFAGPGAAVGSFYDQDCERALPVGNLSLLTPESNEDRQKAYLIRRQWIRLTRQITDNPVPQQRVQMILNQFEHYFDAETVAALSDEAFALLVGVLPRTVRMVRRAGTDLDA